MATRRVLGVTGDVALQLLRLTAASADVLPPLKSAAGGALYIAEIIKKFRSNKAEWQEFHDYVQNATASVVHSLAQTDSSQTDIKDKLDALQGTMQKILASVEAKQDRPRYKRFYKFIQDPDMIADMRKSLDDTVGLFTLNSVITTEINVGKTLDAVVTNSKILSGIARDTAATVANTASLTVQAVSISHKASQIALNATLQRLQHVQGASWDLYRMCLPNTRINIIDDVFAWVDEASGANGAQIYLLTAVAGAGKTTVAHTVAHHFHERGQLVSSFFFDHETEGRSTPIALFTTIAADLARVSKQLADRITAAIENEQGLPMAPLSRQFQELVLKPCQNCTVRGPLVIVIDALDEGISSDLLKILRDDVPCLPSVLHIFLTSRMQPDIDSLCRRPHVRMAPLDIDSSANLLDMTIFVRHRLQQVADTRGFDSDWPGEQLRSELEARAAGLFIWIATVCDYILSRTDPKRELEKLLSESRPTTTSAEAKMDKLYARILESCDWEDEEFVHGYLRAMGVSLATKTPLTITAWNVLFDDKTAVPDFVLQRLSPLLTGMSKDRHLIQPVRVLHQSFRDFLVLRAGSSPEHARFHVDEQKHSQDLALLCLRLLNRDLCEGMAGVGYLARDESGCPGIPAIEGDGVSEALWYACRFWIDHVLDVKPAALAELGNALESFMETKAVLWMEIMATKGRFRGLLEVREWVPTALGPDVVERLQQSSEAHASALLAISSRLSYEDRREDALTAIQEAMKLYRELARSRPTTFTPKLAGTLNYLAQRLSALGRREDALAAIQEAMKLYRELDRDHPAAFTLQLANALDNLAADLSNLGRHRDSLAAIQEAITLYRGLSKNHSPPFAQNFAHALTNFSIHLLDMDRREDALAAIQEAITLYRELATDRPAAIAPDLARALINLSGYLSSLYHREDALAAVEEAMKLYRELAKDRPAVFAPQLANALNNFSQRLGNLGRFEDALGAIQEAIQFYQELAKNRPAVFTKDLALALTNLSVNLSSLGRHEDALAAIRGAITLYRELAKDRPAVFNSDLAHVLNNLSGDLSKLGHREGALAAKKEAIQLYRELAEDRPAVFAPKLADALVNLSYHLSALGCHEDALAAAQEMIQLYRELVKGRPAVFVPKLADALNNLSSLLSALGCHEDALAAIQEAMKLYRELARDRPALFTYNLANGLDSLSTCLSGIGRHDDALAAMQEAMPLYRELAKDPPAAFAENFAEVLTNLSLLLSTMNRPQDALDAIQEATVLYRQLAADLPAVFTEKLASSLHLLVKSLTQLGRHDEAGVVSQEAEKLK
ncbi:TPR-like protein [Ceratobasidium sp. AG-I]|nr:TPR-like protein [Ceratobasidium sp. AG-I]